MSDPMTPERAAFKRALEEVRCSPYSKEAAAKCWAAHVRDLSAQVEARERAEAERDSLKSDHFHYARDRIRDLTADIATVTAERDRWQEEARLAFQNRDHAQAERDRLRASGPTCECARELAELRAERNRLQADSSHAVGVVAGLIAERDRLRAALVYDLGGGITKCHVCGGTNISGRYSNHIPIMRTDPVQHHEGCVLASPSQQEGA